MLPNKREMLQAILDRIEPDWWIVKPSPVDPRDVETECIFQHQKGYREVHLAIDNPLFQDQGRLHEIEALVTAAVTNAKPRS